MEKPHERASEGLVSESGSASSAPEASTAKAETAPAFGGRRSLVRILTGSDIVRLHRWNGFPTQLRRFFIAQNGLCPYCGRRIALSAPMRGRNIRPNHLHPSMDHVVARSRGGTRHIGNKVCACVWSNSQKRDRAARPCELLFAEITAEIVWQTLPLSGRIDYLASIHGRSAEAKKEANERASQPQGYRGPGHRS